MSNFRVRNGMAFGPEGSVGATSAQHILPAGDTTPDVSNGVFFVSANSSATTISYFDLVARGGNVGNAVSEHNGKWIQILFLDNLTTIRGTQIVQENESGIRPLGTTMDFVHYNSSWYQQAIVPTFRRLNVSLAASSLVDVTTANLVAITVTGASLTIQNIVGGVSNQTIRIMYVGQSSQILSFAQSAGGLVLAGTNNVTVTGSASYVFTTLNGTEWFSESGLVSP